MCIRDRSRTLYSESHVQYDVDILTCVIPLITTYNEIISYIFIVVNYNNLVKFVTQVLYHFTLLWFTIYDFKFVIV